MQKITNIKILLTLIVLFTLNGCMGSSSYYVLSQPTQPTVTYANKGRTIGVQKVTVPEYLYKRDLAVAKSSNEITLLSGAVWGEDLDAGLTRRLISFLQKKFNQPSIYAYPWGLDREPNMKVNLHVTRFIAQGDKVYLDANWDVIQSSTNKHKAGLFSTTVPTKSDAGSIVNAMDRAFGELEEDVARGVMQN